MSTSTVASLLVFLLLNTHPDASKGASISATDAVGEDTQVPLGPKLDAGSKLYVHISLDNDDARNKGRVSVGLCGKRACCSVILEGAYNTTIDAESHFMENTNNIGTYRIRSTFIDGRDGPKGWRGSSVDLVVQKVDEIMGVSVAGQENSEDNVMWVTCPSDADSLQVEASSMGSVQIRGADGDSPVAIGRVVQPGEMISVDFEELEYQYNGEAVYIGLCGAAACATVQYNPSLTCRGEISSNNNLVAVAPQYRYSTALGIKNMALVLHPTRFLQVWDKTKPNIKCTVRIPQVMMNEALFFRVSFEGRLISARSEGIQSQRFFDHLLVNLADLA